MKDIEIFCKEKAISYKKEELLSKYTTLRIGGKAEFIIFPTEEVITELIEVIKNAGLPYFIIGGGSNLLISDAGFKGVIINTKKMNTLHLNETVLEVSSGAILGRVLSVLAKRNLMGMEGLIGIPGTVGGAIKGNAGSFGYEIKDCFEEIEVISDNLEIKTLKRQEINFQYRSSDLPENWIIKKAKFRLREDVNCQIFNKMKEFLKRKREMQPLKERSAGCIFKNPEGQAAGYLIEKAGLKGLRLGDIMISPVHANYFINTGNGKASDFLRLMDFVKERIFKLFAIELEPEIKILGVII